MPKVSEKRLEIREDDGEVVFIARRTAPDHTTDDPVDCPIVLVAIGEDDEGCPCATQTILDRSDAEELRDFISDALDDLDETEAEED